jgi:DNA helicase-2/ATP-dependent DNA helicase PcrA
MDKPTTAILCRVNAGLRPFEQALSEAGVPFHYINRAGFFSQPEIKSSLAYLGACSFPANYLISGMLHSDFHPTKFLPKTKIAARFKELKAADDQVSYWAVLTKEPRTLVDPKNLEALQHFVQFVHSLSRYRDLPPSDALKQVLGALKVGDHFAEQETIDNDPLQNLSDLIKMAGKYRSIKEFLDFTRRVAAASRAKKGVALGTIHSAKGLQWHSVFLVSCQEGILPHAKSTDLEGERNCFFVACSRAEQKLTVTYSGQPSGFVVPYLQVKKEEA